MFDEKICLENLRRIVSETADDQNIKNLSGNALRSTYEDISDNIFQLSVFNRHKFKNMLWNLDNLKAEVRSDFQKKCFGAWHSVYRKSVSADLSEETAEDRQKIDMEPPADPPDPPDPKENLDQETETPVTEPEAAADSHKQKPVEKRPHPVGPKPSAYVENRDWFDKLLDFAAAIVYPFVKRFHR